MNEVEELTKNASGWIFQLLNSNQVTIHGDQSENLTAAKQWLNQINQGQLVVAAAPPPEGDAEPGGNGAAELHAVDDAGSQE